MPRPASKKVTTVLGLAERAVCQRKWKVPMAMRRVFFFFRRARFRNEPASLELPNRLGLGGDFAVSGKVMKMERIGG